MQDLPAPAPRRRGRPRVHANAQEASRASSAAWRARKQERKADRYAPLSSSIIDLSQIPPWRRK